LVSFKKMWEDVSRILSEEKFSELDIIQKFRSGFIVKENESTTLVTRDDFVDFWCILLYSNEVDYKKLEINGDSKQIFIYEVTKKLPYVREEQSILKLIN